MKTLDRYLIRSFLKNYLISLLVLMGLYVTLDLVFNGSDFLENDQFSNYNGVRLVMAMLGDIGDYYLYQSFCFFAQLNGIVTVVAAGFTLSRLSRFNELVAILAAGVPILRVAAPIVLTAMFANSLVMLDQELVIPRFIPEIVRNRHEITSDFTGRAFPLWSIADDKGRVWMAGMYHDEVGRSPFMEQVTVLERDSLFNPVSEITADRATWNGAAGRWNLDGGKLTTGLGPGQELSRPVPIESLATNIGPLEIAMFRSRNYAQLLSTSSINQLLRSNENFGVGDLLKLRDARYSQPLSNIVLLLLALPFVLIADPRQLKAASLYCVCVSGLFLGMAFVCFQLAANPPNPAWRAGWSAIMAWLPILIFGPLAAVLLDKMKT